jgi:hypothetical protein
VPNSRLLSRIHQFQSKSGINGTSRRAALHLLRFGLDLENAPRKTGHCHYLLFIGTCRPFLRVECLAAFCNGSGLPFNSDSRDESKFNPPKFSP